MLIISQDGKNIINMDQMAYAYTAGGIVKSVLISGLPGTFLGRYTSDDEAALALEKMAREGRANGIFRMPDQREMDALRDQKAKELTFRMHGTKPESNRHGKS